MIKKIFCVIFALACLHGATPSEAQTKITISMHRDQTCFADAYGVWRHTPGSWAGWTRQMDGHVGEKCYYPTARPKHRHIAALAVRPAANDKQKLFQEFEKWKQKKQKEQELDKLF